MSGLATAFGGLLGVLRRRLIEPEPPLVAFEVRETSIGAVRLARDGRRAALAAAASLELPKGVLRLSLTEPNVAEPEAFRRTLQAVAERAGIGAGSRVAVLLPDCVARVALVPAEELRARSRAEHLELLRFRLRKGVPFEIREARLAFCEIPPGAGRPAQVLATAIFGPILAEYEASFRALGLEPGHVEIAGLALLSALPPTAGDVLLVNWDSSHVSLILCRGGEPVLVRTLTGELAAQPLEVLREASATVLYYRERLAGAGLERVAVRAPSRAFAEAAAGLEEALGIAPTPIDVWAGLPGAPAHVDSQPWLAAAARLRREAA